MNLYCKNCKFYDRMDNEGFGACHFNAPASTGERWPSVGELDWCREFKARVDKCPDSVEEGFK